ncbi:MAG: hypothetical protein PHC41_10390 [Lachnospiraceae bacterium]|nr:hypothetical protein [Lachnospiraceae bacterium]MDD3616616.1 hypothetical protein [Lachnospiraceae bacterium]
METVINKLSEIETAAQKIMDQANEQKQAMSKAMDEKTHEFDASVEADTAKELDKIRTQLNSRMSEEIARLQEQTKQTLANMDKEFSQKHDEISTGIYEKIIRM